MKMLVEMSPRATGNCTNPNPKMMNEMITMLILLEYESMKQEGRLIKKQI